MNHGEWVPIDQEVAYRWDLAEIKRMNRTDDELRQRDAQLARQRVRAILRRLVSR